MVGEIASVTEAPKVADDPSPILSEGGLDSADPAVSVNSLVASITGPQTENPIAVDPAVVQAEGESATPTDAAESVDTLSKTLAEKLGIPPEELDPQFVEALKSQADTMRTAKDTQQDVTELVGKLENRMLLEIYKKFVHAKAKEQAIGQGLDVSQAEAQADLATTQFEQSVNENSANTTDRDNFKELLAHNMGRMFGENVSHMLKVPDLVGMIINELGSTQRSR